MLIVFTPLICFCSILDSNAVTVDAVNFVCIWIGVCDRFTTLPTPLPPSSSSMQCKEYILISLYFYLVPLILISLFHSTQLFIFSSFRCCFSFYFFFILTHLWLHYNRYPAWTFVQNSVSFSLYFYPCIMRDTCKRKYCRRFVDQRADETQNNWKNQIKFRRLLRFFHQLHPYMRWWFQFISNLCSVVVIVATAVFVSYHAVHLTTHMFWKYSFGKCEQSTLFPK